MLSLRIEEINSVFRFGRGLTPVFFPHAARVDVEIGDIRAQSKVIEMNQIGNAGGWLQKHRENMQRGNGMVAKE